MQEVRKISLVFHRQNINFYSNQFIKSLGLSGRTAASIKMLVLQKVFNLFNSRRNPLYYLFFIRLGIFFSECTKN